MRTTMVAWIAVLGAAATACGTTQHPAAIDTAAPDGWVYVSGDVAHPGRVPVVRGRSPFTLTELLALSGPVGEPKFAECERPGVGAMKVDVEALMACGVADLELRDGDVVTVTAHR